MWFKILASLCFVTSVVARDLLITEFMAKNDSAFTNQTGNFYDWIEIHNPAESNVDLTGWFLTDKTNDLQKWEFPATNIPPDSYMLVFASGNDKKIPGEELHANFKLSSSGEFLALIKPDGITISHSYSPAFPPQIADVSYGIYQTVSNEMYFTSPTPGHANLPGASDLGPIIKFSGHFPKIPEFSDSIIVTAQITKTFHDVSSAELHYKVMFGAENTLTMYQAADNIYTSTIPNGVAVPGEMVRYFITAEDISNNVSRLPLFLTSESEKYFGTVIYDPAISTNLPVYHWFVQNTIATDTRTGTRCSFFFNGYFYDNIFCRLRGGSSSSSIFPKRSHKFEFNDENEFKFSDKFKRADEFNLNAIYNDTTYMRDFLSWETLKNAGVPGCYSTNIHVRQNGEFYGLEIHVEQVDGHFLRRLGFNDNGSLYKAAKNGTFLLPSDIENSKFEKKRPDDTNFVDLAELIAGLNLPSWTEKETYMFDNINIPEAVNYLAAHRLFMDWDYAHKNYYMYNDSNDSGEWFIFPWDKDLTFGYVWNGTNIFADNDYFRSEDGHGVSSMFFQEKNVLYSNIFFSPVFQQMYARRTRSLIDEFLQPPDTSRENLIYEKRVYQLRDLMKTLADEDRAKWGWPTNSGFYNRDDHFNIDQGCVEITNDYFAPRRTHLYVTHGIDNGGIIPHAQLENTIILFSNAIVYSEVENQNKEFIEIINTNLFAVDISNWQLSNAVTFVFKGGTVIPSLSSLFVSPNVKAFRARTETPKAGERNFVVGNYKNFAIQGEMIFLTDKSGNEVDTIYVTPEPCFWFCVLTFFAVGLKSYAN